MANIKFSAFTTETNSANVDFLVGYQGTTMKKIAPSNLAAYPFLIDTTSLYSGFVPSGLSGNPVNNTVLGIDAGAGLTTGFGNTFIGFEAAKLITDSDNMVIIGRQAGNASTSNGDRTVAIGFDAHGNSISTDNVAIGYGAAQFGGGNSCVTVGRSAGQFNSGNGTVIIGINASYLNQAANTVSLGNSAGFSQTSGAENTHIGYRAGYSNTTSSNRTAVGYGSLEFNTGSQNTAFGQYTLRGTSGASSGQYNTAVGYTAGEDITTGQTNSLFGWGAGKDITTGSNNTVLGYFAQPSSNTVSNEITLGNSSVTALRIPGLQSGASDGDVLTFSSGTGNITLQAAGGGGATDLNGLSDVVVDNTSDNAYFINIPSSRSGDTSNLSIGKDALNSLTSGDRIVAIGKGALNTLTTSENVTAVGYNAGTSAGTNLMMDSTLIGHNAGKGRSGYRNTAVGGAPMSFGIAKTGVNRNTAIGYHTLYRIDTNGVDNIAIGHEASQFLTTADENISIGDNAARSSTANGHISIGYQAGYSQTSGIQNTNLGYKAGYGCTTGTENVQIGYNAGINNTGSRNTFIGSGVGGTNSASGSFNVSVGTGSSLSLTSGQKNTNLGRSAGDLITTGQNNSCLGYQANPSSSSALNEMTLGNSSISALRCQQTSITSLSDERDKKDIETIPYGLDFVNLLKPKKFVWDNRAETDAEGNEFFSNNKGKKDIGFIAQELQTVDDDYLSLVYDNNPEKLEATYGRLIPVLVKAIQDLSAKVTALENA